MSFTADVGDRKQLEELAAATIARFGRIDTWVNDAGVSIYGRLVAIPFLRVNGGALINVGSEVSDAIVPLQGMYSASKHAVKGFTDALRVEIEEIDKAPVAITLIQPTAVDTPYPQHAKNYLPQEPKPRPDVR